MTNSIPAFESDPHSHAHTVWDRPTRLFHWSLVATVALAWVTAEADGIFFWLHVIFGELVMALVLFRVVWGFIGGRYARFRDFVRGPKAVMAHLRTLLTRTPAHSRGHNPAAGWMILALLGVLFFTTFTGLFLLEDGYIGPLARYGNLNDDPHEFLAEVLIFLIAFHVLAALVMSLLMGENLIRALWTGRKAAVDDDAAPAGVYPPVEGSSARAVVAVIVAVLLTLSPYLLM